MQRLHLIALFCAGILVPLVALEPVQPGQSEDELFGGDLTESVEKAPAAAPQASPSNQIASLSSLPVTIGGNFALDLAYNGLPSGPADSLEWNDSLATSLRLGLFLDARPASGFRVFGKGALDYQASTADGLPVSPDFQLSELFCDITLADTLFLRTGKQTANWGVGYFFSPADLLNLSEIDPADPEAERTGPVAIKAQLPLDIHTVYLYLIADGASRVEEIGIAPKVELLLGPVELSVGGYFQKSHAPAVMVCSTLPLTDFKFFVEAVLSYGSDKTFVTRNTAGTPGLSTLTKDKQLLPSATAGLRYLLPDQTGDFALSCTAQYFFNGQGYEDGSILVDNRAALSSLIAKKLLSQDDLRQPGMHYVAANLAWNGLLRTDFSLSGTWIANLSDNSGWAGPTVKWQISDELAMLCKATWQYGAQGSEYRPDENDFRIGVSLVFGNQAF